MIDYKIRKMTIEDYDEVYSVWELTSKKALCDADNQATISRYLDRNKNLSVVAVADGKIVGTVLCGQDGRRGYLNHVAVLPEYRLHGIAEAMVKECIAGLKNEYIEECDILVYIENEVGIAAWDAMGWTKRDDLSVWFNKVI